MKNRGAAAKAMAKSMKAGGYNTSTGKHSSGDGRTYSGSTSTSGGYGGGGSFSSSFNPTKTNLSSIGSKYTSKFASGSIGNYSNAFNPNSSANKRLSSLSNAAFKAATDRSSIGNLSNYKVPSSIWSSKGNLSDSFNTSFTGPDFGGLIAASEKYQKALGNYSLDTFSAPQRSLLQRVGDWKGLDNRGMTLSEKLRNPLGAINDFRKTYVRPPGSLSYAPGIIKSAITDEVTDTSKQYTTADMHSLFQGTKDKDYNLRPHIQFSVGDPTRFQDANVTETADGSIISDKKSEALSNAAQLASANSPLGALFSSLSNPLGFRGQALAQFNYNPQETDINKAISFNYKDAAQFNLASTDPNEANAIQKALGWGLQKITGREGDIVGTNWASKSIGLNEFSGDMRNYALNNMLSGSDLTQAHRNEINRMQSSWNTDPSLMSSLNKDPFSFAALAKHQENENINKGNYFSDISSLIRGHYNQGPYGDKIDTIRNEVRPKVEKILNDWTQTDEASDQQWSIDKAKAEASGNEARISWYENPNNKAAYKEDRVPKNLKLAIRETLQNSDLAKLGLTNTDSIIKGVEQLQSLIGSDFDVNTFSDWKNVFTKPGHILAGVDNLSPENWKNPALDPSVIDRKNLIGFIGDQFITGGLKQVLTESGDHLFGRSGWTSNFTPDKLGAILSNIDKSPLAQKEVDKLKWLADTFGAKGKVEPTKPFTDFFNYVFKSDREGIGFDLNESDRRREQRLRSSGNNMRTNLDSLSPLIQQYRNTVSAQGNRDLTSLWRQQEAWDKQYQDELTSILSDRSKYDTELANIRKDQAAYETELTRVKGQGDVWGHDKQYQDYLAKLTGESTKLGEYLTSTQASQKAMEDYFSKYTTDYRAAQQQTKSDSIRYQQLADQEVRQGVTGIRTATRGWNYNASPTTAFNRRFRNKNNLTTQSINV